MEKKRPRPDGSARSGDRRKSAAGSFGEAKSPATVDGKRNSGVGTEAKSPWYGKKSDTVAEFASVIVLNDFISARADETRAFSAQMPLAQGGGGGRRQGMQLLRRRAASHRPYKFSFLIRMQPKRKKQKLLVEGMGQTSSCRAKRRARRKLAALQGQGLNQSGVRWLETHLWHTKRMHMTKQWGYTLALGRTDSSERAAVRWAMHHSVIHDASYYTCFELCGDGGAMVETLSSIIHPLGDGRCTPCSPLCMHGGREACGVLHEAGRYPLGAIGPVKLMWEPSEGGGKVDRRVWVWVHPACVEQAQNALVTVGKGVSVQDLSGALARLEIRGHDAWNLAQKLILPSSSGEGDLLWGAGQNDLFHDGAAISVCAWDPRVSCPAPHHRGKFDTGAFAAQDVGAQGSNAGAHASFLADASHEDVSRVPLWSIGASAGAASLWDVTARVAASKRRATDKQIHETRRGRLLRTWAEEGRCCCPVLAVCVKGGGLPPGIDIIVPAGWGGIFWKAAVLAGGRAIGQSERNWLATEWEGSVFPRDWPDTRAGRDCADVECASAVKFWERLPSAIRTNYAKLGVPHPFGGCAAWESLVSKEARESLHVQRIVIHQVGVGALKEVILILCGRGHPTANASICAARVGDLQKGRGHRDKEAAAEEHLEGIASHPVQGEISDPVIIGRVTAGGYSWRRGKGIARALVCAQAYRVALLNQKGDGGRRGHLLVRVRNINCQGDEGFLAFARAAVPDR